MDMDAIILYFLLGGMVFLIIFTVIYYLIKKLKIFFKKSYKPETPTSFKCLDGHIVKSKGELIIDNYLYINSIQHEYEKLIKVRGNPIKYDWYLPEADVYIEYWGFYGKKYMKRKEEKIKLYGKGKLKLISIENVMFNDIYGNLENKLKKYVKLEYRKKHCPNCGTILDNRF